LSKREKKSILRQWEEKKEVVGENVQSPSESS